MTDDKSLAKTVGDITSIDDIAETDQYLKIVNQRPPKEHVFEHPLTAGIKYIPIGVIETMLTKLFRHWNVEVLREGQLLNSVYVTVRLNYLHPISHEWEHQDGLGAVAIQVDKGKNASDLGAIKSNAIMLGLPAAKSFAIKDAAEHIGRAFGRDMNRKDTLAFSQATPTDEKAKSEYFLPLNRTIKVGQRQAIVAAVAEASGISPDDTAGIETWFEEICGMKIDQTKQIEFDAVMAYIEQNSTTQGSYGRQEIS